MPIVTVQIKFRLFMCKIVTSFCRAAQHLIALAPGQVLLRNSLSCLRALFKSGLQFFFFAFLTLFVKNGATIGLTITTICDLQIYDRLRGRIRLGRLLLLRLRILWHALVYQALKFTNSLWIVSIFRRISIELLSRYFLCLHAFYFYFFK